MALSNICGVRAELQHFREYRGISYEESVLPTSVTGHVSKSSGDEGLHWGQGGGFGGHLGQMWTHYGLCSLALANPTLDERAIAQRLCTEYIHFTHQGRRFRRGAQ